MPNIINDIIDKMMSLRIICKGGYWELKRIKRYDGYHRITFKQKEYVAHRISAAYHLGLDYDDKDQVACHKVECNNKACWNPEHIYKGTHSSNMADSYKTSRIHHNIRKTHCKNGHEFTKENTYVRKYKEGRKCIICRELSRVKYKKIL